MLENKSVLIIEDEFLIAGLLQDMLEELGCSKILIAANIPQAIEALEVQNPDLVALDLNLAGTSAIPIARSLRDRNVPFIISSGYGADAIDTEWRKYPVLTRPYDSSALQEKIAQAVALDRL